MDNKYPVRLTKETLEFADKINTNRIRTGVSDKAMSRADVFDKVIVKYFKSNNDKYLEMIKKSGEKNE